MEILTRKDAIAQNAMQYFTGKPCKNDHIAPRYTLSGTCAECIRESSEGVRREIRGDAAIARTRAVVHARRDAVAQLAEIKVRVFHEDWPLIKDTAIGLCLARYPALTASDVASKRPPVDNTGGTGLYRIYVPGDDIELMRQTEKALLDSHVVDVQARRASIVQQVCGIAEAQGVMPD